MMPVIGPVGVGSEDLEVVGENVPVAPLPAQPEPRPADPTTEYVAISQFGGTGLDREAPLRSQWGWHGLEEYEAMQRTSVVGSAFNALRAAALSGGISLLPAVRAASDPHVPRAGQEVGDDVEAAMAEQIMAANSRLLHRWSVSVNEILWEMMEAMYLGHCLAEVVMEYVHGGPDDGMLAVTALKTKPRWAYRFRVDKMMNVVGISGQGEDGWKTWEPQHFAWLTWDPRHGDPRGRSLFRMAHYHWRMLMDLWPEMYKGWKQFGTPWTYGTTAEGAKQVQAVDSKGLALVGKAPMTAEFAMALSMRRMMNGDSAAGPFGSAINVIESSKDSSMVSGSVDILKSEVIMSILLQLRATTEAKHGSRADSETGQDVMGTMIRFVRKWLERFVRRILVYQNSLNYDRDLALRLTPLVTLGDHEHQDFAANAQSVSALMAAGFIADDQLPNYDSLLGQPPRKPGAIRVGSSGPIPTELPPDPMALPAPGDESVPAEDEEPVPPEPEAEAA